MTDDEYSLTVPADGFGIHHRPERIQHDKHVVTDEDGDVVTDENGDPVMRDGGSTIKGYTRFDLFADEYDRDSVDTVLQEAGEWGSYVLSWWEEYNVLVFDREEMCPFEVRVLPGHVAVDVKRRTTSESVERFVEQLTERVGGVWVVERSSERIAA